MQADWRPLFWEPVEGTGERLMAGVLLQFNNQWTAQRLLRDDVLDSLYGQSASNPKRLIDEALRLLLTIAEAGGWEALSGMNESLLGLHPGKMRTTDALSVSDALRHAALLHSSLVHLDSLDDSEDADTSPPEEVNKRFATEVREIVLGSRPDLARNFNSLAQLINGGSPVRFGYFSPSAIMHFSVLHPVRQSASVRYARAKLWELARAKDLSGIANAALITAVPRDDEPTLGPKQRASLRENRNEIEKEADAVGMRLHAVTSVDAAAQKVLELA